MAPWGIAVDDAGVYWIDLGVELGKGKSAYGYDGGALMACSKGGCLEGPTALVSGLTQPLFVGTPAPLVVADGTLYFGAADSQTFSGEILTCSTGGCGGAAAPFASANAWAMATDGTSLFWTTGNEGVVASCALAGCGGAPTSLFAPSAGQSALTYGITADTTKAYWLATGVDDNLVSCPVAGCGNAPSPLGNTLAQYAQIVTYAGSLYFTYPEPIGLGEILTCPTSGCSAGPTVVASGRSSPVGIAVDAMRVYWTETGNDTVNGVTLLDAGGVYACPLTGCGSSPIAIATGQDEPVGIAVDDTRVYWTAESPDGGGSVLSAPKP